MVLARNAVVPHCSAARVAGGGAHALREARVGGDPVLAVLVHRAPEVVQPAVDPQMHLVEAPDVARPRPASAELAGDVGPESQGPTADAFAGHDNALRGQDKLDVA
jgi:hypothetical protein